MHQQKINSFSTSKVLVIFFILLAILLAGFWGFLFVYQNHYLVQESSVNLATLATQKAQSGVALQNKTTLAKFSVMNCPDVSLCYAIEPDGTVFTSKDNGQNWQQSATSLKLENELSDWQLSCPDRQVCYALATSKKAPFNAFYLSTKDGGQNWSVKSPSLSTSNFNLKDLECPSVSVCFVAISGEIQITKDGGQSWVAKEFSNARILNDVSCVDVNTCFVAGGVMGPENKKGYFFVTTDGGQSWNNKLADQNLALSTVSCLDKNNCLVGAEFGTLYQVSEVGSKWAKVDYTSATSPNSKGSGLFQLYSAFCAGGSKCILTGPTGNGNEFRTYTSSNGGQNWALNNANTFLRVKCFSGNFCYGTDSTGTILTSKDGGESWQK